MNVTDAKKIYEQYISKSVLSPDEEFMLLEAIQFLAEKTGDTRWMRELGGIYYEQKNFELALKYYEMADEFGDAWAPEGLGYIWYYGRTGKRDYEKAFNYYQKAAKNGFTKSKIKLADMYKNGYHVEKDYEKYCHMIESAYDDVKNAKNLFEPKPEVFSRLARIRKEEGRQEDAINLYIDTKDFLAQRIKYSLFFGDLNIMKWIIEDLYTMIPIDYAAFDLYDLYYILKTPEVIAFKYMDKEYIVEACEDNGDVSIKFYDEWYRSTDDFFYKAAIDDQRIIAISDKLYDFERR